MRISLLAALMAILGMAPEQAMSDQERIQGTWAAIEVEFDGAPLHETGPREAFLKTRLAFRGDRVFRGVEEKLWAGFTLNPSATPPALDLIPRSGAGLEHKMLYAYRLIDDTLYLCLTAKSSSSRPPEVTSNNKQLLLILKRQPEPQKKD